LSKTEDFANERKDGFNSIKNQINK
jgi:hypothetical protein